MNNDKKISIKDLYWTIEELNNGFMPDTKEFKEAVERKREIEDRLMDMLPEEDKKIFEEYIQRLGEVEILHMEEVYRQGFSLGLQLTSEAYLTNKNQLISYIDD